MKKILGLVISHRRLGNSEILVKEIMNSAPTECQQELIRLTDLQLEPCKACYRCLQPDKSCLLKDDFMFVLEKIKTADALIIGVPVYFLGPHGYYKMLSDRLVGVQSKVEDTRGKPCVIVMPYGSKGWEGYSRAAALVMPKLLRMKVLDCWQVHATLPGESLLNSENIDYAQALGRGLFSGQEYQARERECSFCGSDLFRLLPGKQIECPICGARGILKEDGIPSFSGSTYCRFSEQEMDEHFKGWLLETKERFLNEKEQLRELQKAYREQNYWIKPRG